MATRDGVELVGCERCLAVEGGREYTITKGDAEDRRVFCDACAASVGQVYELKPLGRTARAKAAPEAAIQTDDSGPPAAEPSSRSKKTED